MCPAAVGFWVDWTSEDSDNCDDLEYEEDGKMHMERKMMEERNRSSFNTNTEKRTFLDASTEVENHMKASSACCQYLW